MSRAAGAVEEVPKGLRRAKLRTRLTGQPAIHNMFPELQEATEEGQRPPWGQVDRKASPTVQAGGWSPGKELSGRVKVFPEPRWGTGQASNAGVYPPSTQPAHPPR